MNDAVSSSTSICSLPFIELGQLASLGPQYDEVTQNPQSLVQHQIKPGLPDVLESEPTDCALKAVIETHSAQMSGAIFENVVESSSHNLCSLHGITGDGAWQARLEKGSSTNPHASVRDAPFADSQDVAEPLEAQPENLAAIHSEAVPDKNKHDLSEGARQPSMDMQVCDSTSKATHERCADAGNSLQDDAGNSRVVEPSSGEHSGSSFPDVRISREIEPSSGEQSGSSFPDVNSSTSDCSPSLSQDASLEAAELVSAKLVQLRNCWQRMRIPSAKRKRLTGRLHSPPAITESVMPDEEILATEIDMTTLHQDADPLHQGLEAEPNWKRGARMAAMKDSSEQASMGTLTVGLEGARSNGSIAWKECSNDDASLPLLELSIKGKGGDKSVGDISPNEACNNGNSEQSIASLCEMRQAEPMPKKAANATSTDVHAPREVEEMLNIDVRTSTGAMARIRIRSGKPLKRLMQASRQALSLDAGDDLRFSADGRDVLPEDTAASLGLADGSVIEVVSQGKSSDDLAIVNDASKQIHSQRCSGRKRGTREADAANNSGARNSGPRKRGKAEADSDVANSSGSANIDASWERYRVSRMAELREQLEDRWNLLVKDEQVVDLLGMRYGWGTSESLTVATGGRISEELDQLIAERVRVVVQSGRTSGTGDGALEQTAAKHAESRDAAPLDGRNDGVHELLSKLALDQARMPSPLLIYLESCCTSKSLSDSDASLALARWPEVSAVHRKALWSMVFHRASLQDKAIEAELRARGVEVQGSFNVVRNAFAEFVEKQRPQADNTKGDMSMNAQSVIDAQRAFLQKSEAELSSYLSNEHWPWQLPSKADGFNIAGVL